MPFIVPSDKRPRASGLSGEQHFLLDVMDMCQDLEYMKRQNINVGRGLLSLDVTPN